MKPEKTPWSKGVVLICTKCHKAISSKLLEEEGNSGENLKNFLKKSFKDSGELSKVRVLTTSCLDVCIDDRQAVSYAAVDGETETFAIHPEKDREELLKHLREKIKR